MSAVIISVIGCALCTLVIAAAAIVAVVKERRTA